MSVFTRTPISVVVLVFGVAEQSDVTKNRELCEILFVETGCDIIGTQGATRTDLIKCSAWTKTVSRLVSTNRNWTVISTASASVICHQYSDRALRLM